MTPLITDEPAVLTWAIALAPRPATEPIGRHWWRELVTSTWRAAYDQWQADAEIAAIGYATELEEFKAQRPVPTLRGFMAGLSTGAIAPERVRA